jgi:hypothetical protein
MGVVLGDKDSFFACKIGQTKGLLNSVPSSKVTNSMMRFPCKKLIEAVGMDSSEYALHSCKRGAALAALEAGLPRCRYRTWDVGLARRWSSGKLTRTPRCGKP